MFFSLFRIIISRDFGVLNNQPKSLRRKTNQELVWMQQFGRFVWCASDYKVFHSFLCVYLATPSDLRSSAQESDFHVLVFIGWLWISLIFETYRMKCEKRKWKKNTPINNQQATRSINWGNTQHISKWMPKWYVVTLHLIIWLRFQLEWYCWGLHIKQHHIV